MVAVLCYTLLFLYTGKLFDYTNLQDPNNYSPLVVCVWTADQLLWKLRGTTVEGYNFIGTMKWY